MRYVIMDLEWNGSYCRDLNGYFNEIIEIGAVKLNDKLEIIDNFHQYIKPIISRKLTNIVKNLTNIQSIDFYNGIPFYLAAEFFEKWIKYDSSIVMTWGTTDLLVMLENCRYFLGTDSIPFLNSYADLQDYCQYRLNLHDGNHLGLSKAAQILNINQDKYELHHALSDSQLSSDIFSNIYQKGTLRKFTKNAKQKEFYDRISFKNVIIKDINNSLINKDDFNFSCLNCQAQLTNINSHAWIFKGRAFRNIFKCPVCGREFDVRIQYKLTYDGLSIKKSISPKIYNPNEQNDFPISISEISSSKLNKRIYTYPDSLAISNI